MQIADEGSQSGLGWDVDHLRRRGGVVAVAMGNGGGRDVLKKKIRNNLLNL